MSPVAPASSRVKPSTVQERPVGASRDEARGAQSQERREAEAADDEPEQRAEAREHQALGQKLPRDAAAARAERRAQADLLLAAGSRARAAGSRRWRRR